MVSMLSRIVPANLGTVAGIGSDPVRIGYIFGHITGLSVRRNPQDYAAPILGLKGMFETLPADPKQETYRSQLLFLPPPVTKAIASQLLNGKPLPTFPVRGKPVDDWATMWEYMEFILEIAALKSDTDLGYVHLIKLVDQTKITDPLDGLRRRVSHAATTQVILPAAKTKGKRNG